ncbi:hypothetical protein HX792_03750 [Pseudomonas sp. B6002]|uniref:hypothetical protein n=1 Tax=Pseudomonas sp. B6002 TaxID=2726978 RepID=UPI0015A4EB9C|nr:hypothetical protein [Pseudomonas sp. B6002]NVZ49436.1 hypothetical protein [Pseudomonas sp. B6002]
MAKSRKKKTKAVRLTGVDELSPKLAGLRATVERFKQNQTKSGLGSLDVSGLVKGGGLAAPFVSGIKSAVAFKEQVASVSSKAKATVLPSVPQVAAQNLKDFSASMDKVSVTIGTALLPAVGAVTVGLEPLLGKVTQVLTDNPQLVQGLAAGAAAFSVVQAAVTGASKALAFMNLVLAANPIALVAVAFAVAAGLIVANWTPISAFFSNLWGSLQAAAMPAVEFFQTIFSQSPLETLAQVWEPVLGWFSALWEKLKAILEPIRQAFSQTLGSWMALFTGGDVQVTHNAARPGLAGEQGASLLPPAAVAMTSSSRVSNSHSLTSTHLASTSHSLLQQSAANNRTQLNGDLRVSFDNAPADLRVSPPQTNQPGLSVTPRVGYRSLSLGGSNELA